MGSWSIGHWLLVFLVVVLIFGTKKLRNMGGDLGTAMRDFKKGLAGEESSPQLKADPPATQPAEKATEARRDSAE